MKIGVEVEVALPERLTIVATYTGMGTVGSELAWVQLTEGDTSSKMMVPFRWLTEIKPPLPAEPVALCAVVMVQRVSGAYPYQRSAPDRWINRAGEHSTWAEICGRDEDGAPVQVWPPVERAALDIEFRAHSTTHRTSVTWPWGDSSNHRHIVAMTADAAEDLERLIKS